MRDYRLASCLAIVAFLLSGSTAGAQDAQGLQVTPYAALGTGSASPVGALVTFPVTSQLSVEGDVGYRHTNEKTTTGMPVQSLSGFSYNGSVLWSLPRVRSLTPYAAAGFGSTQFHTPATVTTDAGPLAVFASRMGLRANVGGGLKRRVTDRLELRTDVRWFMPVATTRGMEPYDRGHMRVGVGLGIALGGGPK